MENKQENLLDINIIQGLKELSDDDSFFREIIDLYNEQYPELLNKIKTYFNENDFDNLSKTAHALKGASLNIGAKELAAVCKIIEINSKSGITDGYDELIENIESVYTQTMNAIENL